MNAVAVVKSHESRFESLYSPPPLPNPHSSNIVQLSQNWPKGGGGFKFFLIRQGRDRKKGWDGIIRGDKENLQNFFNFLKGNPNFQGN